MEGCKYQHFQNQHKGLGFGSINFSDYQVLEVSSFKNAVVLSQEVQNLALKDSMNGNENVEEAPMVSKDGEHGKQNYPSRPEADDCYYFLRYGWCKFEFNCRYNHPCNRRIQANMETMKPREENLNRMGQVECKYYLKPEGCKNGKACRYNHSGRITVVAPVLEFNILGLPIRPGEKECPHYRRNGSCKYGLNCWFDHPNHSSMGGAFPHSGYTGLEDTMPCWSLVGPVNEIGPFDPYQQNQPRELAEDSPKQNVRPERSLKVGFGFQRPKTSSCALNDKGLPLRSDMEVCAYYCRYGVCKDGPACRFNHPMTLRKSVLAVGSEEAQVPAQADVE